VVKRVFFFLLFDKLSGQIKTSGILSYFQKTFVLSQFQDNEG
jgi:hypothetical protein